MDEEKKDYYEVGIGDSEPVPYLHLQDQDNNELILEIASDGTVTVHKEGGEPEAAKLFYEALQFEGQTLYQKIAKLEEEIKNLKEKQNDKSEK